MTMLRDFIHDPDRYELIDAFDSFKVGGYPASLQLLRFEVITPNSFMWRVLYDNHVFYLYAEDYIPDLQHVRLVFNTYIGKSKWDFVQCKMPQEFETSAPVISAETYMKPDGADEMMKYAHSSGHDFVFLARSHEDSSMAYDSESAPRGFENV